MYRYISGVDLKGKGLSFYVSLVQRFGKIYLREHAISVLFTGVIPNIFVCIFSSRVSYITPFRIHPSKPSILPQTFQGETMIACSWPRVTLIDDGGGTANLTDDSDLKNLLIQVQIGRVCIDFPVWDLRDEV